MQMRTVSKAGVVATAAVWHCPRKSCFLHCCVVVVDGGSSLGSFVHATFGRREYVVHIKSHRSLWLAMRLTTWPE